jgi:hypothetical protein
MGKVCVKIKRAIGEMVEDAAAEVHKEVQHIAFTKNKKRRWQKEFNQNEIYGASL